MRLLSEVRNYMGNYHVKSGVYHYYRSEYGQAVSFLNKALVDESTLSEGDRNNARRYLALSLKGLAEQLADNGDVEAVVGLRVGLEPCFELGVGRLELGAALHVGLEQVDESQEVLVAEATNQIDLLLLLAGPHD